MSKMLVPEGFINLPDDAKNSSTTTIGASPLWKARLALPGFRWSSRPGLTPASAAHLQKVSQPLCFFTLLQSWKDSKTRSRPSFMKALSFIRLAPHSQVFSDGHLRKYPAAFWHMGNALFYNLLRASSWSILFLKLFDPLVLQTRDGAQNGGTFQRH